MTIKTALFAFLNLGFFGAPAKTEEISAGDNFAVFIDEHKTL